MTRVLVNCYIGLNTVLDKEEAWVPKFGGLMKSKGSLLYTNNAATEAI